MRTNSMKQKLQQGEAVYGPFLKLSDPALIEIAALAGFDFAIIDSEHGPFSMETAQQLVRSAEARGLTPIVRVPENEPHYILRALDIGAHGVQVPQVSTKEAAIRTAEAAKYHPKGDRGVCCFTRAAQYGSIPPAEHFETSNAEVSVIVHIEGVEGVTNLPEILTVEGLDVIFLGPYDLSQSCGVPGQVDHPSVVEKMEEAVKLSREAGKAVGTYVNTVEAGKRWRDIGVQYVSISVDTNIFYNACKGMVDGFSE